MYTERNHCALISYHSSSIPCTLGGTIVHWFPIALHLYHVHWGEPLYIDSLSLFIHTMSSERNHCALISYHSTSIPCTLRGTIVHWFPVTLHPYHVQWEEPLCTDSYHSSSIPCPVRGTIVHWFLSLFIHTMSSERNHCALIPITLHPYHVQWEEPLCTDSYHSSSIPCPVRGTIVHLFLSLFIHTMSSERNHCALIPITLHPYHVQWEEPLCTDSYHSSSIPCALRGTIVHWFLSLFIHTMYTERNHCALIPITLHPYHVHWEGRLSLIRCYSMSITLLLRDSVFHTKAVSSSSSSSFEWMRNVDR